MRITVDLPDDLLIEAEERAVRDARSLSDVIVDARANLARSSTDRRRVPLPTFDGEGFHPGVDLDDSAALLDSMGRSD